MTELNQDQISEIIDFIEGVACGGIYSRYSVRGMLGRSCLGLTYQDSRSLWRDAIGITCELNAEDPDDHLKLFPDGDFQEQVFRMLRAIQIDSLEDGIIAYFPGLKTGG
jgi:hypothetical protein